MIANPSNNYGATRSEPVREKVTHLVSTRGEGEEHLSIDNLANEMRQLREENRRLKDAIIIKSEGNANASMMESDVPTGGGSNASMMSKSTVDSEKLNMRLKAMFKERISCFREAVYLLTGYKVKFASTLCTYQGVNMSKMLYARTDRPVLTGDVQRVSPAAEAPLGVRRGPGRLPHIPGIHYCIYFSCIVQMEALLSFLFVMFRFTVARGLPGAAGDPLRDENRQKDICIPHHVPLRPRLPVERHPGPV